MIDVAVIGNVGIDTNIYLTDSDIDFKVEANFTENIDYVGQAGGYASRGFAQLGYKTAFIGYIGDDHQGRFILEEFEKDGINTDAVFIDPAGTSRSINFMYQDGRRKNFYDGKSHMILQPDIDRCRYILKQSKIVHFNIPNWARHLLPVARESDSVISCDIQDVIDIEDPYRADFIKDADILFFSTVNHPDPRFMIEELLQKHPQKIVVCGMGARGCALGSTFGVQFYEAEKMSAPVIDTNGAGDGLAVGFLSSYYINKYNLQDAIRCGQITARYTCTQKATTSNLIRKDTLELLFNADLPN
jgi:sugar/nucleoside kinase (ribokinase family)